MQTDVLNNIVICFHTDAYMVFATVPHLKECPMQHEVLLHNETGNRYVCVFAPIVY